METQKRNIKQEAIQKGINPMTVYSRIRKQGMTAEEALSAPIQNIADIKANALAKASAARRMIFVLSSPEGETVQIDNLPLFCKEREFSYKSVVQCFSQTPRKKYKGWQLLSKTMNFEFQKNKIAKKQKEICDRIANLESKIAALRQELHELGG